MSEIETSPPSHRVMLQRALDLYRQWNIEPFHVIDIEPFYYDGDSSKEIRCLCFYRIFGDAEYREVGRNIDGVIDKDILPYMLVATGHAGTCTFNAHPESLFALFVARAHERQEWRKTQTVTLYEIESMAYDYHDLRTREEVRAKTVSALARHRNQDEYRWHPYFRLALTRDPLVLRK